MSENETTVVDARGLSCPMPVMLARKALTEVSAGRVEIVVDDGTACDNVRRLAEREGWAAAVSEDGNGTYRLVLTR